MIKNVIKYLIPRNIRRCIHEFRSKRSLESLPQIECDTTNLSNSVSISDILNSNGWSEAKKEIESFQVPNGTGGMSPDSARAIYHLVKYLEPHSVLEIGTHIGSSTILIASAMSSQNEKRLITLDIRDVNSEATLPWRQYGAEKSPKQMVQEMECNFVEFVTSPSIQYLQNVEEKFDLILLDGNHSASTVYQEIPLSLKRLNQNGVILLHDYYPDGEALSGNRPITGPWRGVKRLVDEGAKIKVIPFGTLPWESSSSCGACSLAMLIKSES